LLCKKEGSARGAPRKKGEPGRPDRGDLSMLRLPTEKKAPRLSLEKRRDATKTQAGVKNSLRRYSDCVPYWERGGGRPQKGHWLLPPSTERGGSPRLRPFMRQRGGKKKKRKNSGWWVQEPQTRSTKPRQFQPTASTMSLGGERGLVGKNQQNWPLLRGCRGGPFKEWGKKKNPVGGGGEKWMGAKTRKFYHPRGGRRCRGEGDPAWQGAVMTKTWLARKESVRGKGGPNQGARKKKGPHR